MSRRLDNATLLPKNSTKLEYELEQQAKRINNLPTPIRDPFNPQDCPPGLLNLLAESWSVDYWDNGFSTQKKRDVLAASFAIHQIKGTPESIRHAISSAGFGEIQIIESWGTQKHNGRYKRDSTIRYTDGSGHWAKYSVIMQYQLSNAQARNVRNILNATAPARCQLVELRYLENRKHNATFKRNGSYSYGVN